MAVNMVAYSVKIRWSNPNNRVDMFAESVNHAVLHHGRFPTLCGIVPRSTTDHPTKPTYRWEDGDWRHGVTCKKCLAALKRLNELED